MLYFYKKRSNISLANASQLKAQYKFHSTAIFLFTLYTKFN